MIVRDRIRRLAAAVCATAVLATGAGVTQALIAPTAAAAPASTTLYNSAQAKFSRGNVSGGLADLAALLRGSPNDAQALALQAIWADYNYDFLTKNAAIGRLNAVAPQTAGGVGRVFGAIGSGLATIPNPLPSLVGPQTAIVALGYGLLDNGTMRPELVNRLGATWRQAIISPASPVIVTGGNPHRGITEAAAMKAWLVGHGIPSSRIVAENRAGSTVQNALFSAKLARARGLGNAVLVSSADHLRRAVTDFAIAGLPIIGASAPADGFMANVVPPTRNAQLGIYLDATRTFGLPSGR